MPTILSRSGEGRRRGWTGCPKGRTMPSRGGSTVTTMSTRRDARRQANLIGAKAALTRHPPAGHDGSCVRNPRRAVWPGFSNLVSQVGAPGPASGLLRRGVAHHGSTRAPEVTVLAQANRNQTRTRQGMSRNNSTSAVVGASRRGGQRLVQQGFDPFRPGIHAARILLGLVFELLQLVGDIERCQNK